jgi:hypothetical protein
MGVEDKVEELKHRVEALEQLVRSILSKVIEVKIEYSVPKIVYERRYEYVKISEDEIYGRIIRLALEGFFDEWRSTSDVAKELLRRGRVSYGLQARQASSGTPGRVGGAGEGEEARKEGEVALQEGREVRGKNSDGAELPARR